MTASAKPWFVLPLVVTCGPFWKTGGIGSMNLWAVRIVLFSVGLVLGPVQAQAAGDSPKRDETLLQYNRDIRPILARNCFACHGIDEEARQSDLRLDVADMAYDGGLSGPAIVPGDLESSLLWQRVTTQDLDTRMPPEGSHKQLTRAELSTLRKWIVQGARYEKHWAFEPPIKPDGDGIDYFVDRKLEGLGLAMSASADPRTLVRRVSMTLTGLPPTLAEIETYLADHAHQPDAAYQRMVDRYLQSPHFGEEMARHWLDAARYGDTHGMHLDNERQMWAYRDWVVDAFNRNLPYDQFTIEQLAGDLLANPTQDQLIATGFNRCNVTTGEGGSIDREFLYRYAVDRTSTTAQVWLGLTAGCAVCHDHKYDPISAKEFYSLYAFFNSAADPAMDGNKLLTQPVMKVQPDDYEATIAEFDRQANAVRAAMEAKLDSMEYDDPADSEVPSSSITTEQVWYDDRFPEGANVRASGVAVQPVETPVVSGKTSLPVSGRGMTQVFYESGAQPLMVPPQAEFHVAVFIDPDAPPKEVMIQFHSSGWSHRALWGEDLIPFGTQNTTERFVAGPLPTPGEWVTLRVPGEKMGLRPGMQITGFAFTQQGGTVYFDRLAVTGDSHPAKDPSRSFVAWRTQQSGKDTPGAPPAINQWIQSGREAELTPEQLKKVRAYYLQNVCMTTREMLGEDRERLAAIEKEKQDYDQSIPSTFVYRDLKTPRQSFVMMRGQYDTPGDPVMPGTPAILPRLEFQGDRANRLDLARWMVDDRNPLTARVAVNRFWQQVFGVGLVETSHDFGTQGALPSHPRLLDWLAVSFRESGWDVKWLMREMLVSQTFRQYSGASDLSWKRDPHNRLLARGPRFRLDAEQLRDQALAVSGLINLEMGGKGVSPYQPPNIWEPVAFGGSNTRFYKQDTGKKLYRRTLYTFLKRTAPHPMLVNFDAPAREQSCLRRDRTNTPLQALQLMNDVQHYEAARAFAARILDAQATTAGRIDFAFQTVLARHPDPEETKIITRLLMRQMDTYAAAPQQAKKAITFGQSKPPEHVNPVELAAWSLVANLILNMDEAIMRN